MFTFQSWERVLNFIWAADDLPTAILMAPGKLQDKYCKIIKEKFIIELIEIFSFHVP